MKRERERIEKLRSDSDEMKTVQKKGGGGEMERERESLGKST